MTKPTNEQIRFHLTGDDGKARKWCEKCGGTGGVRLVAGIICPDCDGGWVVDERRLKRAVLAFRMTLVDEDGDVYIGPDEWWDVGDFPAQYWGSPQGFWNNRHNQPWQAALESYVDSCVEPAPDYRNDPEALKAALRVGNWNYGLWYSAYLDRKRFNAYVDREGSVLVDYGCGDAEDEALWNAVQALVEGEKP